MIIYKYIKLFIIKVNDFLQFLASALASILVGLMTLVILYMVFFRYVLNDTPYWSEEVARCMMLWMTFCILPVSYRLGSNVSLEISIKLSNTFIKLVLLGSIKLIVKCREHKVGL